MPKASLDCVGLGITLGAHLTPRARQCIDDADVVFVLASDGWVERWVQTLRPDARSLQNHYGANASRRAAYAGMVETLVTEVRKGQRVCAALYGHPGVFAQVGHDAIARVRAEGHAATMHPGVSSADCLFADLGLDPGRAGCVQFEATHWLCTERPDDPSIYLILWQAVLVGDRRSRRLQTGDNFRRLLVERLRRTYPAAHPLIVYEAPTLAPRAPRIERIAIDALPYAELRMESTLVVPPFQRARPDRLVLARLDQLEHEEANARRRARLRVVEGCCDRADEDG